jgi:hypothetical protein
VSMIVLHCASRQFHLAFSASEVFAGVAVSDWPLPYAVLTYRLPSFVIFVVQPVNAHCQIRSLALIMKRCLIK